MIFLSLEMEDSEPEDLKCSYRFTCGFGTWSRRVFRVQVSGLKGSGLRALSWTRTDRF